MDSCNVAQALQSGPLNWWAECPAELKSGDSSYLHGNFALYICSRTRTARAEAVRIETQGIRRLPENPRLLKENAHWKQGYVASPFKAISNAADRVHSEQPA